MSSYLEKQQRAFKSNVTSAATRVSTKRPNHAAQPESAPSPAPSNPSATSKLQKDAKRKREAPNIVYSQPASTGHGNETLTQITYVIDDFLKKKDQPKTIHEIMSWLSQSNVEEAKKRLIVKILKLHDRVKWIPDPNLKVQTWDSGTYLYLPLIDVRSKNELISHLQTRADARGVTVKDLKDGWPDCEDAIDELEAEHRILVTRTKKDNHARMVWSNDPSLVHKVDPEFKTMWAKIQLPSVDDLVRQLQDAGQKPASEDPSKRVKGPLKPKEKKRKAPRKGGKVTNAHMAHLLKDYDKARK